MKSKYLTNDPLPWLLEKSDPSIRYLTLRDICEEKNIQTEYDQLFFSPRVKHLMGASDKSVLGDFQNYDLFYKGTVWFFAEAVTRGLDQRTQKIRDTALYLIQHCQTPEGGFSFNWNPQIPVACRTGDMLKYLVLSGNQDAGVSKAINWILAHQRHDGGWLHCPLESSCDSLKLVLFHRPGKGLRRENDVSVKSCIYATAACGMALTCCRQTKPSEEIEHSLQKAAEYLLSRKLYLNSCGKPIKPETAWNRDFRLLGYPVLSQYDILYGMLLIALSGRFSDPRAGEAFNIIISKQNQDGTWNAENTGTGMLHVKRTGKEKSDKDKWITLNVLRMLKADQSWTKLQKSVGERVPDRKDEA